MKTYNLSAKKNSLYFILGIFTIMATSCGSAYQNTSYYDRDGIYGNPERPKYDVATSNNTQSNQYKGYFGSLQDNNTQNETFSDVENYSSNTYSDENNNQGYTNSYSDWGSNASNVNVNVYGNNWGWNSWYNPAYINWNSYWGWNLGWGWNSWYGPTYYGWDWNPWYAPYYGWGGNYWYGNNWYNGYGYYQPTRHGIRNASNGHSYSNYSYNGRRNNDYTTRGRTVTNQGTRTPNQSGNVRPNSETYYSTGRTPRIAPVRTNSENNATYSTRPPQNQNSSTRVQSNTPRYNNNSSSTRSQSSSNYGGYSSGSGGGRSSGGRR